jgi:coenzyme F420 biosynthesis associated uncharacterized protein
MDWTLAGTVARGVAALGTPPPNAAAFATPDRWTGDSGALIADYTGLSVDRLPLGEAVDRGGWIDANVTSMATMLDPVTDKLAAGFGPLSGPLGAGAGAVMGAQIGAMTGYLSQRVLGQYEFPVLRPDAPARLLFVAPNLAAAARSLKVESEPLLRWVALHETTHALQFGAVGWLRGHLAGIVMALLASATVDPQALARVRTSGFDLRALVEAVREGGLIGLAFGPGQKALLDDAQALMAVIEGYAEHVMDAVGASVLSDLDRMRAAMDRRRRDRSGLLRLVERLLGLELKLRQYEQGKAFCDAVVAEAGISGLNRVWRGADALPRPAELTQPAAWLARVA